MKPVNHQSRKRWRLGHLAVALGFFLFLSPSILALQSLSLGWKPSPDPRTTGYVLVYGTSSGSYNQSLDVGNVTQATVGELSEGQTYHFAVYAYGEGGLQSDFSNEVAYTIPAPAAAQSVAPEFGKPTRTNAVASMHALHPSARAQDGAGTRSAGLADPAASDCAFVGVTVESDGAVRIRLLWNAAAPVRVCHSATLEPADWQDLQPEFIAPLEDGVYEIYVPAEFDRAQRFFRLDPLRDCGTVPEAEWTSGLEDDKSGDER